MYTHTYDETKEGILIFNIQELCKLLGIHYNKKDNEHNNIEIASKLDEILEKI